MTAQKARTVNILAVDVDVMLTVIYLYYRHGPILGGDKRGPL